MPIVLQDSLPSNQLGLHFVFPSNISMTTKGLQSRRDKNRRSKEAMAAIL